MSIFDYVLIALFVFAMLSTVAQVGKPRKPLDASVAVATVLVDLGLIAWLLISRGVIA